MTNTVVPFIELQFHILKLWYHSFLQNDHILAFGIFALAFCLVALTRSKKGSRIRNEPKQPLVYPTSIPVFGHLLLMAWDSPGLIASVTASFCEIPTILRLWILDIYIISGPECIQKVFKDPNLHNKAYRALSLHNMFKMPKDTLDFWMWDDSGHHSHPHPDSRVPPHLRINYLTHSSVLRFLTGDGLKPLARRFTSNIAERMSANKSIHSEWSNLPDLFGFYQAELFPAAVEAMWGKRFLTINPTFVEDFWAFSKVLPGLAKGYPQWLCPKRYQARDKCLASIKQWHAIISTHFDETTTDGHGWSEDYGAELVKFRHRAWASMPRVGADGAATEDLGMVWAANGNSVPASYWMIAEVIQDEALLSRVRSNIDSCRVRPTTGNVDFDYEKLCTDPLLQSIYTETLRLHIANFVMRGPSRDDFDVGSRRIPKDAVMLISTYNAQTDPRRWSPEGAGSTHPVTEFWPERFLVYPKSSTNGATPSQGTAEGSQCKDPTGPVFSLKGYSNDWIPYGGGQRMCPGRHFAKQEMISSLATMLTLFDIELADQSAGIPENDMVGFGFGALWPKRETPVRIRRKTFRELSSAGL